MTTDQAAALRCPMLLVFLIGQYPHRFRQCMEAANADVFRALDALRADRGKNVPLFDRIEAHLPPNDASAFREGMESFLAALPDSFLSELVRRLPKGQFA